MEDLKEKTIDLTDHVEDLASTFYELTILNLTKKATNIITGAVVALVFCFLSLFILLFAACALAWWLGDVINSRAGGFLLTAGFFLLVMLLIIVLKKETLLPFIRNLIIRKVYD